MSHDGDPTRRGLRDPLICPLGGPCNTPRLCVYDRVQCSRVVEARWQAADQEYRKALGIEDGDPLPAGLGQVQSAGGSRGGRGAVQRGKGKDS